MSFTNRHSPPNAPNSRSQAHPKSQWDGDGAYELAIVLRGDLGAILRFAAGKKDPDFLSEAEALDNLLGASMASRKAGRRNAKTSAAVALEVSQLSLVAGTGFEPVTFRL